MGSDRQETDSTTARIREITSADLVRILEINEVEVQQTSALDSQQLELLLGMAGYGRVATVEGQVVAFIIALAEGTAYASDNYHWFSARYPRFLYIDRIVVGADFTGRRIGRALYDNLFAFARTQGVKMITCEYNLEPPNPESAACHRQFGFSEQGQQRVAGGSKLVSLQALEL